MEEVAKKRMRIMLIGVGILFVIILIYKLFIAYMIKRYIENLAQPISVSVTKVGYTPWHPELKAVGSLRAVRGVNVTSELAGMVQTIYFIPGSLVKEGTLLVQLNTDSDTAQLHALEANADLAQITYNRDKAQFAAMAVSKAILDSDAANLKNLQAQVAQQKATIDKKIIHAPFSGRLGVSAVNPGQYLTPGDKIVTLQQLDPIYVDFYVPQQKIMQLSFGQSVSMVVDAFPGKIFTGKITTIDPLVDSVTRNVEVEATVYNPNMELVPGMFTSIKVDTGNPKNYLTLPQTAISFNSYGSIVYIVRPAGKNKKDKTLKVTQAFVTTGETRGDQITVLQGVKEGDTVVTSGQLKLKNGSEVAINNSIAPTNNPAPKIEMEG